MSDRQRDIQLLLGSLHDHLPTHHGTSAECKASSGLAAAERIDCPTCAHSLNPGWIVDRFKRRTPCVACGGTLEPSGRSGYTKRDGGRGWVSVDPMDADRRPVQTATEAAPPTKPARVVDCDKCGGSGTGVPHLDLDSGREWRDPCVRCNGTGKRTVATLPPLLSGPDEDAVDTRLEQAILDRDDAGSYHELEHALAQLEPWPRRLVHVVYTTKAFDVDVFSPAAVERLAEAMRTVDALMPVLIRVPRDVREAAKQQRLQRERLKGLARSRDALVARDRDIRRLIRRGRPTQWVAGEYGLSVSQVNRIVAGEEHAA